MASAKQAALDVTQATKETGKKIEHKLTLLWEEIDTWQQDNHYILSGYRPASSSYLTSLFSLLHLHNESVNIYTHLLGSLAFLLTSGILYHVLGSRYQTATREDVYAFSCFFLGAVGCLSMSATFHTISNHSHAVAKWGNQLDYAGIVLLIWGSFVPVLFYGFRRENAELMRWYWTMITTLGATTLIVSTHARFRTPALRPFRALMFVLMGLSAVIPMIHGVRVYGYAYMCDAAGMNWVIFQGVLYIVGAGIYAARIPEKWSPGTYDIWGSSHQIFHILVVLAATSHLVGLLKAFDHAHSRRGVVGTGADMGKSWL